MTKIRERVLWQPDYCPDCRGQREPEPSGDDLAQSAAEFEASDKAMTTEFLADKEGLSFTPARVTPCADCGQRFTVWSDE